MQACNMKTRCNVIIFNKKQNKKKPKKKKKMGCKGCRLRLLVVVLEMLLLSRCPFYHCFSSALNSYLWLHVAVRSGHTPGNGSHAG